MLILAILALSQLAWASDIDLKFTDAVLVSEGCATPPINPAKRIQGDYEILIKGTGQKRALRIDFGTFNPADYAIMTANLEMQYRVIRSDESSGIWSDWINLRQLPVLIDLCDKDTGFSGRDYEITSSQIIVYLRFRFPQSVNIPCGIYSGEMHLEVTKE